MTGTVGAVGQTILRFGGRISASVDAHPCPVSPNPCRKMSVEVCFPEAEMVTTSPPPVPPPDAILLLFLALDSLSPMQHGDDNQGGDHHDEEDEWECFTPMSTTIHFEKLVIGNTMSTCNTASASASALLLLLSWPTRARARARLRAAQRNNYKLLIQGSSFLPGDDKQSCQISSHLTVLCNTLENEII